MWDPILLRYRFFIGKIREKKAETRPLNSRCSFDVTGKESFLLSRRLIIAADVIISFDNKNICWNCNLICVEEDKLFLKSKVLEQHSMTSHLDSFVDSNGLNSKSVCNSAN